MTESKHYELIDDLNMGDSLRIVGFDFETLTPAGRAPVPIELGALMIKRDLSRVAGIEFNHLIKPPEEVPFTPFDINQTGITPESVRHAKKPEQVMTMFEQTFSPYACVFIGQNVKYDYAILSRYNASLQYCLSRPYLDVIRVAKHFFPNEEKYNLDHLASLTGVRVAEGRHRALYDVQITMDIFSQLVRKALSTGNLPLSRLISISETTNWGKPKQMNLF